MSAHAQKSVTTWTCFGEMGNYLHDRIADVTVRLLSFPSGVKAHIFVTWLHAFKEQKSVVVEDRRMAQFDDLEKENKLLLYPHSIDWKNHLPDFALVIGNPGRIVGWLCIWGKRICFGGEDGSGACEDCQHTYWKEGKVVSLDAQSAFARP